MTVYMVHHRESEDYDDHIIFSTPERAIRYMQDSGVSYLIMSPIELDRVPEQIQTTHNNKGS